MIPPVKTWSVMGQSGPLMFNRVHTCFAETHTHKKRDRKLLLTIASFQGTKHRPALSEGPDNAL